MAVTPQKKKKIPAELKLYNMELGLHGLNNNYVTGWMAWRSFGSQHKHAIFLFSKTSRRHSPVIKLVEHVAGC
jgi:hypothetical protein